MSVVVEWNGDIFKKSMNDAMVKALIRSTNLVQGRAKNLVPIDTGNLRSSIITGIVDNKLLGVVSTNSEYSPYIEFGTGRFSEKGGRSTPWVYLHPRFGWLRTVGQKPQPFMRPAIFRNKETVVRYFREEAKKAIDK